jgi:hypothetical protein
MIYKTWGSTFRKCDATREANKYKAQGLKVKIVKRKMKFAPKGYSYDVKVAGSLFNITKGKK